MSTAQFPTYLLLTAALIACNTPKETEPVAPPSAAGRAPGASAGVEAPPPSTVIAPSVSKSAMPPTSASELPLVEEPLPEVAVRNIGMHIGGGPNDRATKRPIEESVAPHFDGFRKCWKLVEDPSKPGDFGVDLLIPHEGGKAVVTHPRTAIAGEGFEDCVVRLFEAIDYKKPKTGKTTVSYSLRFTPGK